MAKGNKNVTFNVHMTLLWRNMVKKTYKPINYLILGENSMKELGWKFEGDKRAIGNLQLLSFYVCKNLYMYFKMDDSGYQITNI